MAHAHESTSSNSDSARAGLDQIEYNPTDMRARVAAIFAVLGKTLGDSVPPHTKRKEASGGGEEDGEDGGDEWRSRLGWEPEANLGEASTLRNSWGGPEWREGEMGDESEVEHEWGGRTGLKVRRPRAVIKCL